MIKKTQNQLSNSPHREMRTNEQLILRLSSGLMSYF